MEKQNYVGKIFVVCHTSGKTKVKRPVVAFTTVGEANRIKSELNAAAQDKATYEVETISCFEQLAPQMLGKLKKDFIY